MDERFMNLTDLGEFFGVSRVIAGRYLVNVGLRDPGGEPTQKALDGGFFKEICDEHRNVWFFIWHAGKTLGLIEECIQDPAAFARDRQKRAEERKTLESLE